MRHMYKYLHTMDGLTVVINGRTLHVATDQPHFQETLKAVLDGLDPIRLLDIIEGPARRVMKAVNAQLTENLRYDEGVVYYRGQPLHNPAVRRLLQMVDQGLNIVPLARFIEKQQRNPDKVVHDHLYEFLEFGKIPLTEDGDFLVYKAVRPDYRDIYSGRFSNRIGDVCEVQRQEVNPDRNQTCSYGLHVCSYTYLPHFAHADGHVMICKVNPEDVVAIPSDYNNTKMRVRRYEVVGEVTTYYKEGRDELGEGPLVRAEEYEVWYADHDSPAAEIWDTYYTLAEAKAQADALKRDDEIDAEEVWVEKANEDAVLYTA